MTNKLDVRQKHLLRLVAKGQECPDGWATVSKQVYPLIQTLPEALVELQPVGDNGWGRVRLTPAGQNVVNAMEYL